MPEAWTAKTCKISNFIIIIIIIVFLSTMYHSMFLSVSGHSRNLLSIPPFPEMHTW